MSQVLKVQTKQEKLSRRRLNVIILMKNWRDIGFKGSIFRLFAYQQIFLATFSFHYLLVLSHSEQLITKYLQ